jgi:hypothetical protein
VSKSPEKWTGGFDSGRRAGMMTLASHTRDAENGRDGLCLTACYRPAMSRTPATFLDFEKNRSGI